MCGTQPGADTPWLVLYLYVHSATPGLASCNLGPGEASSRLTLKAGEPADLRILVPGGAETGHRAWMPVNDVLDLGAQR